MIDMLLAAKRTGLVECHFCIQGFVTGFVSYDTPIFKDFEICTFKNLVLTRTDKNKFHMLCRHHLDK